MRKLAIATTAFLFVFPAIAHMGHSAAADVSLNGADTATYELEKTHAFLTWTVRHNGISDYSVNFTDFDATLDFDADNPEASTIELTINPTALQTNHPDPDKKIEWENELGNAKKFFNATEFPTITFVSTAATLNGEYAGTVTGDLTFLGMTKPVSVKVTYNGVTNVPWFGQRDVIGFNAVATFKRSDWGLTTLKRMVSDEVVIDFSGEFLQVE